MKLIEIANRIDDALDKTDAKSILKVIGDYSKALDLLDDYDHKTLELKNESEDEIKKQITYEDCINIINTLRFNEESNIFALERKNGLSSIINNIYQTYDGNYVYKSIYEKAANFLYLIVKNHVFIDEDEPLEQKATYFQNNYKIRTY